jgi:hypothetical protein
MFNTANYPKPSGNPNANFCVGATAEELTAQIAKLEVENERLKDICRKSSCMALDNAFKVESLERRNAAILEIVNALFNGKVAA